MDLVSHAIAGASVGLAFGRPITGALCGCLPDMVLGVKRISAPTVPYTVSHSLLGLLAASCAGYALGLGWLPAIAVFSHILLDLQTHGPQFAPALFYPWSEQRFSAVEKDWEFFNKEWWIGLLLTSLWSVLWIILSHTSVIGYLS